MAKSVHSRAYNVDVSEVGIALCEHAGLGWLGPNVPNFDCTVARARGHHVLLVRGPPEKQESIYKTVIFSPKKLFLTYLAISR